MSDKYQPWIVLHHYKGGRLGSFPLTDENLADIRRQVYMYLIQTDINGCQHWAVTGPKRKARRQN